MSAPRLRGPHVCSAPATASKSYMPTLATTSRLAALPRRREVKHEATYFQAERRPLIIPGVASLTTGRPFETP